MSEKIDELKARLDNLCIEKENLERELEELNSIEDRALTDEEINKHNIIEAKLSNINSLFDVTQKLFEQYNRAFNLIFKLKGGIDNKSLRTRTIRDLIEELKNIKINDKWNLISDEDIEKLYTERNNEESFNNHLNSIDDAIDKYVEKLIEEVNKDVDELERKNRALENPKNSELENSKSNNNKRKISAIIGSLVLLASLIFVIKSCNKDDDKEKDTKMINDTTIEDTIITPEPTIIPTIIEEDKDELVVIDDDPIISSIDEVENDKETDLVNRANLVAKTNFFEDAYPSDIVEVLRTISDKQMWSIDNAGYAQAFNTTFNGIVENYLFDQLSEEDINKVEALRHLAKEDSDLDRFLENYTTLLQDVLANPYDQSKKDEMMKYITIFATSLNGFNNEPEVLTNDERFNEHAEVKDFYNWYFAYDSIIKPTYPLFYPKALEEIDGMVVEQLMYMTNEQKDAYMESHGLLEYKDAIYKQIKLYEMQYLMESALVNHPLFCEIKNINDAQELTLGGE